jgi:hypothetical protein
MLAMSFHERTRRAKCAGAAPEWESGAE